MVDKRIHKSIVGYMRNAVEKEQREAKIQTAVRLEATAYQRIAALARTERRIFADMLRLLVNEALDARKGKQ